MKLVRLFLFGILLVVTGSVASLALGLIENPTPLAGSNYPIRAYVPEISSDEPKPDLALESVRLDKNYLYTARLRNVGTEPLDLSAFGFFLWHSADPVLDRDIDQRAGGMSSIPLGVLPPGQSTTVGPYIFQTLQIPPFVIFEVDPGVQATDVRLSNNVVAVLLPRNLVKDVAVEWTAGKTATRVTWTFNAAPPYYIDNGFLIRFGLFYEFHVGHGVRELTKMTADTGHGLSCFATVHPLEADGNVLPGVKSTNICQPQ